MEHIWDLGYSDKQSTGLGLPFVRQVIENHKGAVHVESEKNHDTKVIVCYGRGSRRMECVKTILAIDDNRDILYTLEQIFNFQGWRPLLANGYEEADKLIKKEKIDLILVDYHMPGVDGISAVKEIRKAAEGTDYCSHN